MYHLPPAVQQQQRQEQL
uniref:Uncharacterized protein n=1 Tax=Timema shepardi TaxID=629360 RepID=A0A7R9B1K6_TIMSH|nr:unnamed protein product [Timema shepardi]